MPVANKTEKASTVRNALLTTAMATGGALFAGRRCTRPG